MTMAAAEDALAFPMLTGQIGLWHRAHGAIAPKSGNSAFRVEITGPVDAALVRQTLSVLVQRHEALRATGAEIDGDPHLLISENAAIDFDVHDLSADYGAGVEAEVETDRLCESEAQRPFNLRTGPLVRFRLIRVTSERSILTLTFSALVVDGWSVSVILEEFSRVYAELSAGRTPVLPELALQFGDYAVWQRSYMESDAAKVSLADAVARFAGYRRFDVPSVVAPGGDPNDSAIVSRELPRALTEGLSKRAAATGETKFVVAASACLAALHVATGQQTVSMATPVAGRHRAEFEDIVGPLVNHIVLQARFTPGLTLTALIESVGEYMLDAFQHQDLPIDAVAEALAANGVEQPLFSVCFACQQGFAGARAMTYDFADLHLRTLPSKSTGALYDLFFFMVEREGGWRLSLDYRTARYTHSFAEGLLDRVQAALQLAASTPDAPITIDAPAPISTQPEQSGSPTLACEAPSGPGAEGEHIILPASASQERFWQLAKAMPDSSAFNMPIGLRIAGPLSAAILKASIDRVVERHETLRARFEEIDGGLCQVIAPSLGVTVTETDLRHMDAERAAAELSRLTLDEARAPFDLASAPLFRAHLYKLGANDHALEITIHHSICDGQSVAILQKELWHCYERLSAAESVELEPLTLQFGDFAAGQREWSQTEAARTQLDYWVGRLGPPLPVLDVPLDRKPASFVPPEPATVRRQLDNALGAELKRICRSHGTTPYAVTCAAFAALLSRYAASSEVLLASPYENRSEQTASIIGPFAGLVPLRLSLADDPSLATLIDRVADTVLDGAANLGIPFESVLEAVEVPRRFGRNPLFQFFFLYQTAFLQALRAGPLAITPLPTFGIGTRFELQLAVIERPQGTTAEVEYNRELFDAATVEAILDDYIGLLSMMLGDLDRRVSELPDYRQGMLTSGSGETRWTVAQEAALVAATREQAAPGTRSDLELGLCAAFARVLKRDDVGTHDNFFDLGGTSIRVAQLVAEIGSMTGLDVPMGAVFERPTVAGLIARLQSNANVQASIVVPLQEGSGSPPLYCLCGIELYRDLARSFDDQDVFGIYVQYEETIAAQLARGETPQISLDTLSEAYLEAILRHGHPGPYRLAGLSAGGIIAIEVASKLRAMGKDVQAVLLFDTALTTGMRKNWSSWVMHHATDLSVAKIMDKASRVLPRLAQVPGNLIGKRGGELSGPLCDVEHARQRAFGDALRNWKPNILHTDFTVVLFRAIDEMRSLPHLQFDDDYGWRPLISGSLLIEDVAGTHISMVRPPHADALAASIARHLQCR